MHGKFTRAYRARLEKFFAAQKGRRERRARKTSEIIDAQLTPAEIVAKGVKRWQRTHCQECQRKKPSSQKRLCEDCRHQTRKTSWRRNNNERADAKRRAEEEKATRGHSIQSSLFHLLPIIRFYERYRGPQ